MQTDKLLRAFIEVSGYTVEEVTTFDEAEYLHQVAMKKEVGAGYMYPEKEYFEEVDYKVTKKDRREDLVDVLGTLQFIDTTIDFTPPAAPRKAKEYIGKAINILNRMIEDDST